MRASPFEPDYNCGACSRLTEYRRQCRRAEPEWHNGPVASWIDCCGEDNVKLLIIGMAPGLKGANRTGRPFTGDYAGDLLYQTLKKYGFARGKYGASSKDGLELSGCAITNAVRCVPPQNRPVGAEINNCRSYLEATFRRFKNLQAMATLGKIAHESTIRALGGRVASAPFGHNRRYKIKNFTVFSSYHCSRYNTNTGRLTEIMFDDVFGSITCFINKTSA